MALNYMSTIYWIEIKRLLSLQKMIPAMYLSCSHMLGKWECLLSCSGRKLEIDVWPYLRELTGDVISRTAFGSSHEQGKRIFELQEERIRLILPMVQFGFIPGWRYVVQNPYLQTPSLLVCTCLHLLFKIRFDIEITW